MSNLSLRFFFLLFSSLAFAMSDCRNFHRREDTSVIFSSFHRFDHLPLHKGWETDYTSKIKISNFTLYPSTGVNSFVLRAPSNNDFYVIRLVGPELTYGTVQYLHDGTYSVEYCVERPGLYELHIIIQTVGKVTLNRELFGSPFSLKVGGNEPDFDEPPISSKPPCETMWNASFGRWKDVTLREESKKWWEDTLFITREKYAWVPYECSLAPKSPQAAKRLFENSTICVCGDSYSRTLLNELLLWGQVFALKHVLEVEKNHKSGKTLLH